MTYIAVFNDDYLEHHGVKGMKWGVRRAKDISNAGLRGSGHSKNSRFKNYLQYEGHDIATGRKKAMYKAVSDKNIKRLQKKGYIDSNGRSSDNGQLAYKYLKKREDRAAYAAAGATAAAAMLGAAYLGRRSKKRR